MPRSALQHWTPRRLLLPSTPHRIFGEQLCAKATVGGRVGGHGRPSDVHVRPLDAVFHEALQERRGRARARTAGRSRAARVGDLAGEFRAVFWQDRHRPATLETRVAGSNKVVRQRLVVAEQPCNGLA